MTDVKQVKVDNWGIYFLQRLKHFFNRTDYCDLTLQFQDNAQLKVHRLVLSACTEYFELLERTCEMYEDCLVMPDDLQADVVVPIVNFMYTGHLEFKMDSLERLYQTSQILNMPVLTKLLESHRIALKTSTQNYSAVKRFPKASELSKPSKSAPTSNKRSYSKAFDNNSVVYKEKKAYNPIQLVPEPVTCNTSYGSLAEPTVLMKKHVIETNPRPTRYELPEELDQDNIFDNSFCNISYTCKPLMVHPENIKSYSGKKTGTLSGGSSSSKLMPGTSTVDIVECKRVPREENIFDDTIPDHNMSEELDIFPQTYNNEPPKDTSHLFDQILDDGPRVTIETKDSKAASNLDHAKIISEVLKKYPHLVKSNKNIKLKILNTPAKGKRQQKPSPTNIAGKREMRQKIKSEDYTYETDVIDSQQAAKLIAMGAENVKGPWICLICGTPGKALHFTSYYKFRRHLVDVHHEKPVSNICEYCGLRSLKRNYLLHHLYSQHGVDPPPQYHFPKCNKCNYIALTEGLLVKHKMTHKEMKNFSCNVCSASFGTTKQLLIHIQLTGHKYSAGMKANLQCIYCLKTFLRDRNLYAHLKTYHRKEAKCDGVIEDSEDEKAPEEEEPISKPDNRESQYHHIKYEPSTSCDNDFEEEDVQYQIQQGQDGDIQISPRKQLSTKQKILNSGFESQKPSPQQKSRPARKPIPETSNFLEDISIPSPSARENDNVDENNIVVIDNIEYIMRENQLIPRKPKSSDEYIISDMLDSAAMQAVQPTTSMDYTEDSSILMKKTANINQPIQIVVSNEEEYKALMSSNHPILFDNGEANKTLTVLTGPHNTTLESATINLNNTQSNDMMIIQEDYPLNVTEAVSTDNSNIVVVYSHPVDDQSKQFQILTTGGIGSQFVQSSAIITQNYETVTTTAPVTSAHVLEPQPNTTWHKTIQSSDVQQVPITTETEVQSTVVDQGKPEERVTNDDLSDLPDVHLAPEPQVIESQDHHVNDASNELNDVPSEHVSQADMPEIQEETHNIPESQIETDILRDSVVEDQPISVIESIEKIQQMPQESENTEQVLSNDANQDIAVHESVPMETESIVEQTSTDMIPQQEKGSESLSVTENTQITENVDLHVLTDQEPLPESQAYDDIVEINHVAKETPPTCVKADEKIQNLTSEWSEDEFDVNEDASANNKPVHTAAAAPRPESPEKLEETIENIQKEVQSHLNIGNATLTAAIEPIPEVETEESESSIPEDTLTSLQEPQIAPEEAKIAPVQNDPQAQEKISSLLNDWEDNDSQEENNDDVPAVESKSPVAALDNKATDAITDTTPKAENIKNLVSDWDDDEEEIKN